MKPMQRLGSALRAVSSAISRLMTSKTTANQADEMLRLCD